MLPWDKLTVVEMGVPDVGEDLMAAQADGLFSGPNAEQLMAIVELLRHREISLDKAETLSGVPKTKLLELLTHL